MSLFVPTSWHGAAATSLASRRVECDHMPDNYKTIPYKQLKTILATYFKTCYWNSGLYIYANYFCA